MEDCLFCRIVAGTVPAARVYENDRVLAIRDIQPQAPVHILLLSKRHVASVVEAASGDPLLIADLVAAAVAVARAQGIAERGFRLLTNSGPEGGQAIAHLHFHLLGGRPLRWPPG
ncbi:MAG TPA: histidine triad nucleotide-binding protein [bacterium]|nr:histidine triad nucleotide-binding protein [bacterium]